MAPGPPEARAASSAPRPGPEVEEAEVGVIEEALEETEEVAEDSEIEGAEADSGDAAATNKKSKHLFVISVFLLFSTMMMMISEIM